MSQIHKIANKSYLEGYTDGYRRGQMAKLSTSNTEDKSIENMYSYPPYVPYLPITYYTAVIIIIAIFIILILIASYIDIREDYISPYRGNCLLKLSTIYSGSECL